MSKYDDALHVIEQTIEPVEKEKISIAQALNRVLREDIVADMDMPPFDKAAMDGYACRASDLGSVMRVVEHIPAGHEPLQTIGDHQCARIMTGAKIPLGADMVFMLEDTEQIDSDHVRCINPASKKNICYRGEDFRQGDILLYSGIRIQPAHIGIMASVGRTEAWVSQLPRITILATGSELVEPDRKPVGVQIRNSNSYMLIAMLEDMFLPASYAGIIPDDLNQIRKKAETAIAQADILILTGGASKGDFDFTTDVLQYFGYEILVTTTGVQPGNPMIYAKKGGKYCFGLSGNPVSSFVQFELFVKPFLYRMLQYQQIPSWYKATLASDVSRKKAGRTGIIPVKFNDDFSVTALPFHGSAHLNALADAQALMQIPEQITVLKKGEYVYVRPL